MNANPRMNRHRLFGESVVTAARIEAGERVWVIDTQADGRRTAGVITSVSTGFFAAGGFAVRLDRQVGVVICSRDRRGVQWDFLGD